ncbi:MAG TPA: outer membrane beta-barrel protein [Terriglobales bacterium]|nr:outer membrane beta-barrel protein [Terriglobales bacterium]
MRLLTSILALFVLTAAASAQLPSGNVFVGYSYNRSDLTFQNRATMNGWEGSLEGKVFPLLGIVADVDTHSTNNQVPLCTIPGVCPLVEVNSTIRTFTFGPQLSVPFGRFSPFVHGLVGAAHLRESDNGFDVADTSLAYIIGGGLDYHLFYRIKWRVQADAVETRFLGGTQSNVRVSTGVVVHF